MLKLFTIAFTLANNSVLGTGLTFNEKLANLEMAKIDNSEARSVRESDDFCSNIGGQLPAPKSRAELDLLFKLIQENPGNMLPGYPQAPDVRAQTSGMQGVTGYHGFSTVLPLGYIRYRNQTLFSDMYTGDILPFTIDDILFPKFDKIVGNVDADVDMCVFAGIRKWASVATYCQVYDKNNIAEEFVARESPLCSDVDLDAPGQKKPDQPPKHVLLEYPCNQQYSEANWNYDIAVCMHGADSGFKSIVFSNFLLMMLLAMLLA
jgi:hypothetical protein